jgi:hypothetical protein
MAPEGAGETLRPMTLLLVLLILLPWSIWRQMHAHQVTAGGLVKLPLIFAAIGLLGFGTSDLLVDGGAVGYLLVSVGLSVGFGLWRGARLSIWHDESGVPFSKGNRTTIALWGVLLASKFAMGAVASITGLFPAEHAGDVFMFLALSFVAQNAVVAVRSGIARAPAPVPAA